MKNPLQLARAGKERTIKTADRIWRDGAFRTLTGLGLLVTAQVELPKWLSTTESAAQNSQIDGNILATHSITELGGLGAAAALNKISPNSSPWKRRALLIGIGGPALAATSVLLQRWTGHDPLPHGFMDTSVREILTTAIPAVDGTVAASFLVAPRPLEASPASPASAMPRGVAVVHA